MNSIPIDGELSNLDASTHATTQVTVMPASPWTTAAVGPGQRLLRGAHRAQATSVRGLRDDVRLLKQWREGVFASNTLSLTKAVVLDES